MNLYKAGNDKPDSHIYFNARQEWDERMGSLVIRARNWQLIAFGLLAVSLLMGVGFLTYAKKPRMIPYIVQVEKDGTISTPEDLRKQRYQPNQTVINSQLVRFIELSRTLSVDGAITKRDTGRAFAFVGARANSKLVEHLLALSDLVGSQTREIKISTILNIGEKSKQVEWIESIRNEFGELQSVENWNGIFTFDLRTDLVNENIIRINPLGFFIVDLDWEKRKL